MGHFDRMPAFSFMLVKKGLKMQHVEVGGGFSNTLKLIIIQIHNFIKVIWTARKNSILFLNNHKSLLRSPHKKEQYLKKTICILASRKLYYETIPRRALGFVKIWMTSQAKYELKRIICYVHMCTRANVYREQEYLYTVANRRILEESFAEKTSLKYNNDDASLCSIFFGITRYKKGPTKF